MQTVLPAATAPGGATAAGASPGGLQRNGRVYGKPHICKIDFYGSDFVQQVFFNAERESTVFEHGIILIRLVQSQRQPRAASAAGGKIHADGAPLLVRKVSFQLLAGVFSHLDHIASTDMSFQLGKVRRRVCQ